MEFLDPLFAALSPITFFFIVLGVLTVMTVLRPKTDEDVVEHTPDIELTASTGAKWAGGLVVAATVMLYAYFW